MSLPVILPLYVAAGQGDARGEAEVGCQRWGERGPVGYDHGGC
jgi:hypothetical protein